MLKLSKITGMGLMALTLAAGLAPGFVSQAHAGRVASTLVPKVVPIGPPGGSSVNRVGPVDGLVNRVGPVDGLVNRVGPVDGLVNKVGPVDGIKLAPSTVR